MLGRCKWDLHATIIVSINLDFQIYYPVKIKNKNLHGVPIGVHDLLCRSGVSCVGSYLASLIGDCRSASHKVIGERQNNVYSIKEWHLI